MFSSLETRSHELCNRSETNLSRLHVGRDFNLRTDRSINNFSITFRSRIKLPRLSSAVESFHRSWQSKMSYPYFRKSRHPAPRVHGKRREREARKDTEEDGKDKSTVEVEYSYLDSASSCRSRGTRSSFHLSSHYLYPCLNFN